MFLQTRCSFSAYEVRPELKEGECGVSACRAMLSTDIGLLTVDLGSNVVANINSDISSTFAQKLSLVGKYDGQTDVYILQFNVLPARGQFVFPC